MSDAEHYLELATAGEPTRLIPLTKARVLIGRVSECDIRLTGAYVSRRHARLERGAAGSWRIIDLGSANGTRVNGHRAEISALADGDVLSVGEYRLTLHIASAEEPAGDDTTAHASKRVVVPSTAGSAVVDDRDLSPDTIVPARILAAVHQAERRLGRSADIPSLVVAISREFRAILRPKRVAVGREDGPDCEWPVVIDASGQPADGSDLPYLLVPRVEDLKTSVVISWNELTSDGRAGVCDRHDARSLLFPISAGGRRLGHVYVELGHDRRRANDEAIEFLALLTRQVALIWANLELQATQRAAEAFSLELSEARQIQRHLLPGDHELDPRLDVAAQNIPALTVSGDYYDFQVLEPGRVAFILADVMGHGLSAGLLMASVQPVFRTGVSAGWDLLRIDQHIHDAVAGGGQGERFVTGVLGICDLAKPELTVLSAGHAWPSIWCGDRRMQRDKRAYSPPWGIFLERTAKPSTIALRPADWSVVAYSDGLVDTRISETSCYGAGRVVELHRRLRRSPADEICEEILSDVLSASDDSSTQQDDMTLLVLRNSSGASEPARVAAPGARVGEGAAGPPSDQTPDRKKDTEQTPQSQPGPAGVPQPKDEQQDVERPRQESPEP